MQNDSKPRNKNFNNKGPRKGSSNYGGKNRQERPKAPSFSKRSAAIAIGEVFSAIREDQKNRPNRWSKEARTNLNESKKLVNWAFDSGSYTQAVERVQEIASQFKVSVSVSVQPEPEAEPAS